MQVTNTASSPAVSNARAWYVLAVLFLVYVCSTADRHILSILAQDIKVDLALSDTEIGLLTGPAIALLYGIMSVPVAHLADRVHRVRLLSICLLLWSLFTAAGSLAANAFQLMLSRVGVSAAEGGGMPASASILSDCFPPEKRPLALTIYSSSAMVGIFFSFGIGGFVAANYGWRVALVVAALPGLLLCLLLPLTIREPARGATDTAEDRARAPARAPLVNTLGHILGDRLFRVVLIGSCLTSFSSAGVLAWGPTFAMRTFGADTATVGAQLGLGIALLGGVSMALGGLMAHRVRIRHGRAATFRVVAVIQLLAVPILCLALTGTNLGVALVLLGLFYGLMHLFVPVYWTSASAMPATMRATTSAVGVLTMVVVGSGLAPLVVGLLSDLFSPWLGTLALASAISVLALTVTLSSVAFLVAGRIAAGPNTFPAQKRTPSAIP